MPGQEIEPTSYVKEALKWQYNWILLTAALILALVSRSATPLVLAAGLELMYLSIVPNNRRFQRLVRSRMYEEEKRRRVMKLSTIFHELPEAMRTRYADMRSLCQTIRGNYALLSSTSQIFSKQIEDQLEGLLQGYLRLLHAAYKHREHLRTAAPEAIRREVAELERLLPSEPPKVQEINRKRIEIMTKRLEKYERVRENCAVIDAQCAAIEDVLKLIRDQSVTLRDPQQVSDQLENLVRDVEQTEETVRQVEAVFDLGVPDLAGNLAPLPADSSASAGGGSRIRIRH